MAMFLKLKNDMATISKMRRLFVLSEDTKHGVAGGYNVERMRVLVADLRKGVR